MTLFVQKELYVAVDRDQSGRVGLTAVFASGDEAFDDAAEFHCFDQTNNIAELQGTFTLSSIVADLIELTMDSDGDQVDLAKSLLPELKAALLDAVAAIDAALAEP